MPYAHLIKKSTGDRVLIKWVKIQFKLNNLEFKKKWLSIKLMLASHFPPSLAWGGLTLLSRGTLWPLHTASSLQFFTVSFAFAVLSCLFAILVNIFFPCSNLNNDCSPDWAWLMIKPQHEEEVSITVSKLWTRRGPRTRWNGTTVPNNPGEPSSWENLLQPISQN